MLYETVFVSAFGGTIGKWILVGSKSWDQNLGSKSGIEIWDRNLGSKSGIEIRDRNLGSGSIPLFKHSLILIRIGKRLLGMRVYSPENIEWVEGVRQVQLNNCSKTRWKGALMRSMFKNLSSLLMIPGHMTPLFNRMRRAIYDSVAGTIVVERVIIQAS